MATEKDFEDAIAKYPELIEEGLQLQGRQVIAYGRRMDLVFSDSRNGTLILELKWGPIKDQNIGQIMSYEGMIVSHDNPAVRVMLVGTRVPPNIQRSLDFHGIAWKEIPSSQLRSFLQDRGDTALAGQFDEPLVSIGMKQHRLDDVRPEAPVLQEPRNRSGASQSPERRPELAGAADYEKVIRRVVSDVPLRGHRLTIWNQLRDGMTVREFVVVANKAVRGGGIGDVRIYLAKGYVVLENARPVA
jgi:hypothetical protein